MKVAITGASGFVGSNVLRALVARGGHELVAIYRVKPDATLEGVHNVVLDLAAAVESDYDTIGQPDVLIHCAWSGLPNFLSLHHFESELPAQYRFLRSMIRAGLPSILVTGTCFEYGMVHGEMTEERDPAPANPYAYAKVALLAQLRHLQDQQPFDLTWARLFYMWGERQAPTSIYPLLRAAAERGDAAFPMSRGDQLRDYLPVNEVATMLIDLSLNRGNFGVVNICSGEPISVRALVERWIDEHGWSITPELGRYPYSPYEPLAFWGAVNKLKRILGKI